MSAVLRTAFVALLLLVAACDPGTSVDLAAGEGGQSPEEGREQAPLPELPPLHERAPNLYDEDGCLRLPPDEGGGVECGPEEAPEEAEAVEDERAHRNLYGFRGPYYTEDVSRDAVVLLEDTVRTTGADAWEASGLVRNETGEPVGEVTVTARLSGGGGDALGEASTTVPVDPLRAGEPGPFALEADVPAGEVAEVTWQVEAAAPAPDRPRETEITIHWERPLDGDEDVVLPGLHEDGDTRPYLLYGSAENGADSALAQPTAVTAWLDDAGRVLHVDEARFVELGSGKPLRSLRPGALGDFLHVIAGEHASALDGTVPMFWVVGS